MIDVVLWLKSNYECLLFLIQDLLKYYFNNAQIVDGAINDTRIVGTITLIAVLALAIVGMDWVTRVSLYLSFVYSLLFGREIESEWESNQAHEKLTIFIYGLTSLQVQMGLLFLLIGSQIDFVIGFFMGPLDNLERSQGFVGMSCKYKSVCFNQKINALMFVHR